MILFEGKTSTPTNMHGKLFSLPEVCVAVGALHQQLLLVLECVAINQN